MYFGTREIINITTRTSTASNQNVKDGRLTEGATLCVCENDISHMRRVAVFAAREWIIPWGMFYASSKATLSDFRG